MKGLAPQVQRQPTDSSVGALNIEKESDASLVVQMGKQVTEPMLAENAVAELYRRHARKMIAFCIGNFLLYQQNHEELVQRTFRKALRGAPAKVKDMKEGGPAQATSRHIKFWLYQILMRTCIDARRKEKPEREQRDDFANEGVATITYDPPETTVGDQPTPQRVELVREFLLTLNKRNQDILYNTAQFFDLSTNETVIPTDIHDALLEEFGMKETALRTQRLRLLKRLKKYIETHE